MGIEDDDDIDVEAILARAAATREKAADIDTLMAEAAKARDAVPDTRQTLVPEPPAMVLEPPAATAPDPFVPEPVRDPFAEVAAVLAKARAARGLPPEPEPDPVPARSSDPFAAAEAALEKAKAARAPRSVTKKVEQALAEAELRRLKRDAGEDPG